jgi:hypothetical protein
MWVLGASIVAVCPDRPGHRRWAEANGVTSSISVWAASQNRDRDGGDQRNRQAARSAPGVLRARLIVDRLVRRCGDGVPMAVVGEGRIGARGVSRSRWAACGGLALADRLAAEDAGQGLSGCHGTPMVPDGAARAPEAHAAASGRSPLESKAMAPGPPHPRRLAPPTCADGVSAPPLRDVRVVTIGGPARRSGARSSRGSGVRPRRSRHRPTRASAG